MHQIKGILDIDTTVKALYGQQEGAIVDYNPHKPGRHAEAITSRPLFLYAVGKQTRHGGQTKITLTSMHGHYQRIRERLVNLHGRLLQTPLRMQLNP